MTTSIRRLAASGLAAMAITLTACGATDPGVEAGRSDRTHDDATSTVSEVDVTTTDPAATEPPVAEPTTAPAATDPPTTGPPASAAPPATEAPDRPPAPAASGPGSVSADELVSAFLPTNPDLLGAAFELTDGRNAQTFLDEEMTFSGMDPVIEIAGAPITRATLFISAPTFDADGTLTDATRVRVSYRMAVEVENDDIDGFAMALRDELQPIVEAANPDGAVSNRLGEAILGNPIFGLQVGPDDNPSTVIDIDQHYVIVPRLVNDLLLAVNVTRTVDANDIVLSELPGREQLVDAPFDKQLALFADVPAPLGEPTVGVHGVIRNVPSAGTPTISRYVEFVVPIASDGFETYVDSFGAVVEADEYDGVENFGDERSFDHNEERLENEFVLERDGESVVVRIRGDVSAYPG